MGIKFCDSLSESPHHGGAFIDWDIPNISVVRLQLRLCIVATGFKDLQKTTDSLEQSVDDGLR